THGAPPSREGEGWEHHAAFSVGNVGRLRASTRFLDPTRGQPSRFRLAGPGRRAPVPFDPQTGLRAGRSWLTAEGSLQAVGEYFVREALTGDTSGHVRQLEVDSLENPRATCFQGSLRRARKAARLVCSVRLEAERELVALIEALEDGGRRSGKGRC